MDVQTISMDKAAAQIAYRQYRSLTKRSKEDEEIMHAYRRAAQGTPLINIAEAIKAAGLNDQKLPKLAIAKADSNYCFFQYSGGATFISSKKALFRPRVYRGPGYVSLPAGSLPGLDTASYRAHRAVVPIVPPNLRPKGDLSHYHILWEAEWKEVPRDPMLLKHVSGYIYAVLAVWDLTEIERLVLSQTRVLG